MLCYHFSLEALLQDMAKNNPTEKEIEEKFKAALKHESWQKRKCKVCYKLQGQIYIINYNYLSEYVFFRIIVCYF